MSTLVYDNKLIILSIACSASKKGNNSVKLTFKKFLWICYDFYLGITTSNKSTTLLPGKALKYLFHNFPKMYTFIKSTNS